MYLCIMQIALYLHITTIIFVVLSLALSLSLFCVSVLYLLVYVNYTYLSCIEICSMWSNVYLSMYFYIKSMIFCYLFAIDELHIL